MAPPLQLVLPVPTSLLLCLCRSSVFLCLLCLLSFGFHRSQTDSLKSTNTLCASGLSYRSADKQRPYLDSGSGSDVDLFLDALTITVHLFALLALLASFFKDFFFSVRFSASARAASHSTGTMIRRKTSVLFFRICCAMICRRSSSCSTSL